MGAVAHLNELNEKYSDRGLSVVAITSEEKEPTEKWIADKGATYAYAYEPGEFAGISASGRCGIEYLPRAILVSTSGVVVFSGSPRDLSDADIERALDGALQPPLWKRSVAYDRLRDALASRKLVAAIEEATALRKIDAGVAIVAQAIQNTIAGERSFAATLEHRRDWCHLDILYRRMADELDGSPEADDFRKKATDLIADPRRQDEIDAYRELRRLWREFSNDDPKEPVARRQRKQEFCGILKGFVRSAPQGSYAAASARQLLEKLK